MAVLTERTYTFTASEDKTIRMWKAGKCERVFQGKTDKSESSSEPLADPGMGIGQTRRPPLTKIRG